MQMNFDDDRATQSGLDNLNERVVKAIQKSKRISEQMRKTVLQTREAIQIGERRREKSNNGR